MGREDLIPSISFREDINSIPLEGRRVVRKKMLHELDNKVGRHKESYMEEVAEGSIERPKRHNLKAAKDISK